MPFLKNVLVGEKGQDMIEYSLAISLVVLDAAGHSDLFRQQVSAAVLRLAPSS